MYTSLMMFHCIVVWWCASLMLGQGVSGGVDLRQPIDDHSALGSTHLRKVASDTELDLVQRRSRETIILEREKRRDVLDTDNNHWGNERERERESDSERERRRKMEIELERELDRKARQGTGLQRELATSRKSRPSLSSIEMEQRRERDRQEEIAREKEKAYQKKKELLSKNSSPLFDSSKRKTDREISLQREKDRAERRGDRPRDFRTDDRRHSSRVSDRVHPDYEGKHRYHRFSHTKEPILIIEEVTPRYSKPSDRWPDRRPSRPSDRRPDSIKDRPVWLGTSSRPNSNRHTPRDRPIQDSRRPDRPPLLPRPSITNMDRRPDRPGHPSKYDEVHLSVLGPHIDQHGHRYPSGGHLVPADDPHGFPVAGVLPHPPPPPHQHPVPPVLVDDAIAVAAQADAANAQLALEHQIGQALLAEQALKTHHAIQTGKIKQAAVAAQLVGQAAAQQVAAQHVAAGTAAARLKAAQLGQIAAGTAAAAGHQSVKTAIKAKLKHALKNRLKTRLQQGVVGGVSAAGVQVTHHEGDATLLNDRHHIALVKHRLRQAREELFRRLVLLKPYFQRGNGGFKNYVVPSVLPDLPKGVHLTPVQVASLPKIPIKFDQEAKIPPIHIPDLKEVLKPPLDVEYIEYILTLPEDTFVIITNMSKRQFLVTLFPRLYRDNVRHLTPHTTTGILGHTQTYSQSTTPSSYAEPYTKHHQTYKPLYQPPKTPPPVYQPQKPTTPVYSYGPPPTRHPVTPATTRVPFTPAPTHLPVTPAPTHLPITPAPTHLPITLAPTHPPFTPAPTHLPITLTPTRKPFTPAPTHPPTVIITTPVHVTTPYVHTTTVIPTTPNVPTILHPIIKTTFKPPPMYGAPKPSSVLKVDHTPDCHDLVKDHQQHEHKDRYHHHDSGHKGQHRVFKDGHSDDHHHHDHSLKGQYPVYKDDHSDDHHHHDHNYEGQHPVFKDDHRDDHHYHDNHEGQYHAYTNNDDNENHRGHTFQDHHITHPKQHVSVKEPAVVIGNPAIPVHTTTLTPFIATSSYSSIISSDHDETSHFGKYHITSGGHAIPSEEIKIHSGIRPAGHVFNIQPTLEHGPTHLTTPRPHHLTQPFQVSTSGPYDAQRTSHETLQNSHEDHGSVHLGTPLGLSITTLRPHLGHPGSVATDTHPPFHVTTNHNPVGHVFNIQPTFEHGPTHLTTPRPHSLTQPFHVSTSGPYDALGTSHETLQNSHEVHGSVPVGAPLGLSITTLRPHLLPGSPITDPHPAFHVTSNHKPTSHVFNIQPTLEHGPTHLTTPRPHHLTQPFHVSTAGPYDALGTSHETLQSLHEFHGTVHVGTPSEPSITTFRPHFLPGSVTTDPHLPFHVTTRPYDALGTSHETLQSSHEDHGTVGASEPSITTFRPHLLPGSVTTDPHPPFHVKTSESSETSTTSSTVVVGVGLRPHGGQHHYFTPISTTPIPPFTPIAHLIPTTTRSPHISSYSSPGVSYAPPIIPTTTPSPPLLTTTFSAPVSVTTYLPPSAATSYSQPLPITSHSPPILTTTYSPPLVSTTPKPTYATTPRPFLTTTSSLEPATTPVFTVTEYPATTDSSTVFRLTPTITNNGQFLPEGPSDNFFSSYENTRRPRPFESLQDDHSDDTEEVTVNESFRVSSGSTLEKLTSGLVEGASQDQVPGTDSNDDDHVLSPFHKRKGNATDIGHQGWGGQAGSVNTGDTGLPFSVTTSRDQVWRPHKPFTQELPSLSSATHRPRLSRPPPGSLLRGTQVDTISNRKPPVPQRVGGDGLPLPPLSGGFRGSQGLQGPASFAGASPSQVTADALAKLPAYLREAPSCATVSTNRSFCLMPKGYPSELASSLVGKYREELSEIRTALSQLPEPSFDLSAATAQLPTIDASVECESVEKTVELSWARDVLGSWFVIMQTPPFTQPVTVTTCSGRARARGCRPLLQPRPLIALQPRDSQPRPFLFDFPLPVACVFADPLQRASSSSGTVVVTPGDHPVTSPPLDSDLDNLPSVTPYTVSRQTDDTMTSPTSESVPRLLVTSPLSDPISPFPLTSLSSQQILSVPVTSQAFPRAPFQQRPNTLPEVPADDARSEADILRDEAEANVTQQSGCADPCLTHVLLTLSLSVIFLVQR